MLASLSGNIHYFDSFVLLDCDNNVMNATVSIDWLVPTIYRNGPINWFNETYGKVNKVLSVDRLIKKLQRK